MTPDEILRTEYSEEFDRLRKNRMIASYFRYGPIKENAQAGMVDEIASLEKRLALYKQTGNTELLIDVANFAMNEFMYPQHPKAHFRVTDHDESPGVVGIYINEIKNSY